MAFVIVVVVLAIVVLVISSPWRAALPASGQRAGSGSGSTVAELEAAREAKYAEIREAELDHQMGKLSDEDYDAVDKGLRGEAIDILQALDAATMSDR
jgi:hypothetical protein